MCELNPNPGWLASESTVQAWVVGVVMGTGKEQGKKYSEIQVS